MYLKNIRLLQFKNYLKAEVQFSPEINCFVGMNGSGKTNLLDAIHYLCLTKSALNGLDGLNIKHEENFFTIHGAFDLEGKEIDVKCVVETGKKKQILQNAKPIEKMSDHVGLLPVVMIAPDDTQLIKGGSEDRRRFFDTILCQLDRGYLERLMRYQHFLKQRNALIKQFADRGRWNQEFIEPYDRELISLSKDIAQLRKEFLETYNPMVEAYYGEISDKQEPVSIQYETACLEGNFEDQFKKASQKDLILKRTNKGIHKDDYVFEIDGHPIKKFGSQGQQKSYVIALKLAQFQILYAKKLTKPILLLDDIFDKLDDNRIAKLMNLVATHQFGQLFITDARPERSKKILTEITGDIRFMKIDKGTIGTPG